MWVPVNCTPFTVYKPLPSGLRSGAFGGAVVTLTGAAMLNGVALERIAPGLPSATLLPTRNWNTPGFCALDGREAAFLICSSRREAVCTGWLGSGSGRSHDVTFCSLKPVGDEESGASRYTLLEVLWFNPPPRRVNVVPVPNGVPMTTVAGE